MSHSQTSNKKKLSSLLDELRTTALDLNTTHPLKLLKQNTCDCQLLISILQVKYDVHETYRESAKIILSLTKIIRLHPEFTNLSEPGKSHADFLVKWEMIEKYAKKLGHMWYYDGKGGRRDPKAKETRELFAKEGREIRVWCEVIQDVQIKGFGGEERKKW